MKIHKVLLPILVGALTVGAGVYGYHYGQVKAGKKNTELAAKREASTAISPNTAKAQPAYTAATPEAVTPDRVAAQEPVPADVLRVLPNLPSMPKDWRTYQPTTMTVAPIPNYPITYTATSIKQDGNKTVWIGKSNVDNSTLVAIESDNRWTGLASFPNGNDYTMFVSGGHSAIIEANPDTEDCGADLEPVSRSAADMLAKADSLSSAKPDAAGVYTSDVVFFYDSATETAANKLINDQGLAGTADQLIGDSIKATVIQCNTDLTNSLVTNFQWNMVGLFKIPDYDNKGDLTMATDLSVITSGTDTASTFASQKAIETGADQSVLLVGSQRTYSGLAWTPGHQAVVVWGVTHMTIAHEMAHNLGCNHDRQTENAKDSDGIYAYGFRYTATNGQDTGTIMSYAGYRLPYFSNPKLIVNDITLGVADDQPKASDNARMITTSAANMASYRSPIETPKITQQPVGTTATAGQSISLSVTATGGNLTYQWYQEKTAISGATSSTYSKSNVGTTDAGNYTVIVQNTKGSAQSDTVVVTVNTANTGGNSGGGGGGGGAPSFLFYGALALLAGARRFFSKKVV